MKLFRRSITVAPAWGNVPAELNHACDTRQTGRTGLWHTRRVVSVRCWRARGAIARILALLCCCLALVPRDASGKERASRSRAAAKTAKTATRGDAIVLGSSSVNQVFGHLIARELEQRGYRVTRKGVSAAGLARPDYRDMNVIMDELPVTRDTAAVFLYLGMNDAQAMWLWPDEQRTYGREFLPWSDSRWQALYTQRAQQFFERICRRGAHRVIVLLPVDVERDRLQSRLSRIRELQTRAATASSCAVALATEGDAGSFEVDGVAKRTRDGFHLSAVGANAVWERIETQALALVGVAAASQPAPGGKPWRISPCRLGQGLRYRYPGRPSEWTDTLGVTASTFGASVGCATVW